MNDLDLARNFFGPLDQSIRRRIRRVITSPNARNWEDAHSVIIGSDGWMTLWQAVIAVDPTFPRTGRVTNQKGDVLEEWRRIPSTDLILRAVRFATH